LKKIGIYSEENVKIPKIRLGEFNRSIADFDDIDTTAGDCQLIISPPTAQVPDR
jgi:hypothetical protein